MIMLAGILLLIPGFVTDIIGLLLFLPPVRDLAWRFLRPRRRRGSFRPASRGFRGRPRRVPRRSISTRTTTAARPIRKSPWRIGADD